MGSIVNTRCVADAQDALDVYYGSLPHFFGSNATSLYEVGYVKSETVGRASVSGWSRQTVEYPLSGGSITAITYIDLPGVNFPSCDPAESFNDGILIGWGFGAVLIAVAALKMMKKGAR